MTTPYESFAVGGGSQVQPVPCEWFAKCTRKTDCYIGHPVLGQVPCCIRCARLVGAIDKLRPILPLSTAFDTP